MMPPEVRASRWVVAFLIVVQVASWGAIYLAHREIQEEPLTVAHAMQEKIKDSLNAIVCPSAVPTPAPMAWADYPLKQTIGATLKGTIELDGNEFIDCKFEDATFIYKGTLPTKIVNPHWLPSMKKRKVNFLVSHEAGALQDLTNVYVAVGMITPRDMVVIPYPR